MKKKLLSGLAAALFLCLGLSSCSTENPAPADQALPEASEQFRSIYRFPTEGPRKLTGEGDILSASGIARNKAEIGEVLGRILDDVMAKKLIPSPITSYPGEVIEADEDYAIRAMNAVSKLEGYVPEALLQGFEVDYQGIVSGGKTTWKAQQLRFVYIDPNENIPDRNMFQVSAAQLASYSTGPDNNGQPLLALLNNNGFEGYPIYIESVVDSFGLRTYEEAVYYDDLMEAGKVDKLFWMGPS